MPSSVPKLARRAAAAVVLLSTFNAQATAAITRPGRDDRRSRRGFDLFSEVFALFAVNNVRCGIDNLGQICPPAGGRGFGIWPRGTPDSYIFNSGLQAAGIIAADAGFEWAGDTVGAFFMEATATQLNGEGVTEVFNSLEPVDAQDWPTGAVVRDTAIYHDVLIDRRFVSQQDLWVRTWEGNPTFLNGRDHPMGILIEERGMAWTFPTGNEDILYFVFDVYNVTASNAAVYGDLDPAIRDEIAEIGARFQAANEPVLSVDIPDDGYAITDVYVAFFMDPDVAGAGGDFSTAVLPFQMAVAYDAQFLEPSWDYPLSIFGPPFAPAPGFIGVKYLKSPIDPATGQEVGLTLFSNTSGGFTGFNDPRGVAQLWRYLSGNLSAEAGDQPCTVLNPQERKLCFLDQEEADTRFYQSSGPLTLEPGSKQTVVVAYVHAAPLAAPIQPFIGGSMRPGIPTSGPALASGQDTIRDIDRAAGWGSHSDIDGNGSVSQDEVVTVPRSLLQKALVAQAVFDNKFLLPFAPEPPNFFLVPGRDQVTVVWEPSATEQVGDPFVQIARSPLNSDNSRNALFDPNFRELDVEGYRIYRGRTPGALELIAQFDYTGTSLVDFTGSINYGNCAPELGIQTQCPAAFETDYYDVLPTSPSNSIDLSGHIVQVPQGARVLLANGATVLTIEADTAVTGQGATFPGLTNTGVPFAFVDRGVRNSLIYFYAITAFDVNSVWSGPTSLESARIAQSVTPRAPAPNAQPVVLVTSVTGDDGEPLDLTADWPAIDPDDGTFSGNIPPTNTGRLDFLAAVLEALPGGDISVRIDSVGLGWAGGFGPSPSYYLTMQAGGNVVEKSFQISQPSFNAGGANDYATSEPLVPYDSALSRLLGLTFTDPSVRMPVEFTGAAVPMAFSSEGVGTASGRYGVAGFETSRYLAHSRWFDEGGRAPADPTITSLPDQQHNAGMLSGASRIWAPSAYRVGTSEMAVVLRGKAASGSTAWYPADFVVTWEAGGAVTVRDITHHLDLPHAPNGGSGYAFLTLASVLATGIDEAAWDGQVEDGVGTPRHDVINYHHLYMTNPTCSNDWWAIPSLCLTLSPTAELQPLDLSSPPDGVADGNGIVILINGEPFFIELTALPAAGTQWHLRAVSGVMSADCTPALGPVMDDCENYTFTPNVRPTNVPGLYYNITVEQQFAVDPLATADLDLVHTVPDPYYVTNALEISPDQKVLTFVNLPVQAIIRIYSLSGVLIDIIEHNDPAGGGEASWSLRNRNNQFVASGVYFYHLETPSGQERVGRFTVVSLTR